ncbi:threonine ammonia-lyase [Turicibacter sp. TJ11]|uniref:threonine ammonia-lyase n=1 Tax=Turicibacter sp. TJ11 TaxID=2806443 RepID=UPI001F2FC842|nr:threonine ammonia-lyase [Turicibacter sp. TJ11]
METVTFQMILEAAKHLKGVIKETDFCYSETLSELTEGDVYLKLENLQQSGSFKIRGAYNKMIHLSDEEKNGGVVASSAGNHAQGVAISASKLGIKSTIVMPKSAPFAKIYATRKYGGEVVLHGEVYDEAYQKAIEIQKATGATFVHPFNDPYVIAGQGTIGVEIMAEQPDLDVILVPIGGGGIAAGVALAAKTINPNVKVIGVQTKNAPSMYESLRCGHVEVMPVNKTIADGIAVGEPGELTFSIIKDYVDEIITVSETEISQAVLLLLENCNLVCEGAGAVSVAAMMSKKLDLKDKKVGAILSGGNIDINMIESIINHAMITTGRRTEIKVMVNHKPGELSAFLETIAKELGNILIIHQSRSREGLSMYHLEVTVVVETLDAHHKQRLIKKLIESGYEIEYTN